MKGSATGRVETIAVGVKEAEKGKIEGEGKWEGKKPTEEGQVSPEER